MPNYTTLGRLCSLALIPLSLGLISACGDDETEDDEATERPDREEPETAGSDDQGSEGSESATGDESNANDPLPPPVEDALLSSDDFEGWEAERSLDEDVSLRDCVDGSSEVFAAIEGGASVELFQDHGEWEGTRGVFQNVVTFADEDAARDYVDITGDAFADCLEGDDPGSSDFVAEDVVPLDLADADLGENALGQQIQFEPNPWDEMINSMDVVVFQRDDVVVSIAMFLPFASELDAVELASTAYDDLA